MEQILQPPFVFLIPALGLLAGLLGGMLGVGGSVLMIPGLTIMLGYHIHLYQAGAMIANVAVSIPAALRHRRAGALNPTALKWMLPTALVAVLIGVYLANLPIFSGGGSIWLGRILALFLLYVILLNLKRMLRPRRETDPDLKPNLAPTRGIAVGSAMGVSAGLLGIGGGGIAVPLQQVLLKLPLKTCIANSSTIICISASVGAAYKVASLPDHHYTAAQGALLGLMLAPTAAIGGRLGAALTHKLPLGIVRIAFLILITIGAWKMAAIPWSAL